MKATIQTKEPYRTEVTMNITMTLSDWKFMIEVLEAASDTKGWEDLKILRSLYDGHEKNLTSTDSNI